MSHGVSSGTSIGYSPVKHPMQKPQPGGDLRNLLQVLQAQVSQAVRIQCLSDFFQAHAAGDQLVLAVDVGAEVAWIDKRRGGNADVHLGGASLTQHVGDLGGGGAADNRVVYQDNALAGNRCLEDIELDVYRSLPLLLGRQDEGTADVTVLDKADAVWNAGLLRHSRAPHPDRNPGNR